MPGPSVFPSGEPGVSGDFWVKEIGPGCSLEGMMLRLKVQYFGHLMRRVDSLERTDAGRDWGQEAPVLTSAGVTHLP